MRHYFALLGFVLAIATCDTPCRSDELEQKLTEAHSALSSEDEFQPQLRYAELFNGVGSEEISGLKWSEHDSIAIQACWEEIVRTFPEEARDIHRPDKTKLSRFLGFLEGRARSSIPEWWAEVVLNVSATSRDNVLPGEPAEIPYHNAGLELVAAPLGTTIHENGNSYTLQIGIESVSLPDDLLEKSVSGEPYCSISGQFTEEHCFVAVHRDVGHPFILTCLDRGTGTAVWQSEVCGCWWLGGSGGFFHWVNVVVNEGRVVVFGVARSGFYAHGFQSESGDTLFRFSTGY